MTINKQILQNAAPVIKCSYDSVNVTLIFYKQHENRNYVFAQNV